MSILKKCEWCNKEFEAKKSKSRFCSLSCSGNYGNSVRERTIKPESWVEVTCAFCSIEFKKKRSSLANSKSGLFFCCREHKDLSQRIGGIKEIMPPHYGNKTVYTSKDYSFARTNSCERCGYDKYPEILHVHHIDRDRSNNVIDNLICLCPNCHDEEHLLAKDGRFH